MPEKGCRRGLKPWRSWKKLWTACGRLSPGRLAAVAPKATFKAGDNGILIGFLEHFKGFESYFRAFPAPNPPKSASSRLFPWHFPLKHAVPRGRQASAATARLPHGTAARLLPRQGGLDHGRLQWPWRGLGLRAGQDTVEGLGHVMRNMNDHVHL